MFCSDAWNAWAVPWKDALMVAGTCISCIAFSITSMPSDSDSPARRSNERVTDGSCPRWLTLKGPTPWVSLATALRGTMAPLDERT